MSTENGKRVVSNSDELVQALAAGFEASNIDVKPSESAIAAARAEGVEQGKKEAGPDMDAAMDLGAEKERKRICGIQALARRGFEKELTAAVEDPKVTPEAFALKLMTEAADRGISIDAIENGSPKAAQHSEAPEIDAANQPKINSAKIYAARRGDK